VVDHAIVFPCADEILWILKHVDLDNRYIINVKWYPIASFQAIELDKYYHLENRTQSLDEELIRNFPHKAKHLFKIWYKTNKTFKLIPSRDYLTSSLRTPYQYIVAMFCRLYGDKYASKFTITLIPLIYYCVNEVSSFDWANILSAS
jgi:hypothetical protein